jgi:hypothetical protein
MSAIPYMPHVAFDTLVYANKLKDAGLDPKIAEVQAELQATVLTDFATKQLATKNDLCESEQATKNDLTEIKNEIEKLRFEVKFEINELRNELRSEFKNEILKLKNEILLKVGAMFGASTIILGALITILSRFH